MTRFGCILLAFFILSCGGNSTGPEIEPEPIPNHEAGDLVIDLLGGAKMAFIWVEPDTLIVTDRGPRIIIEISKGFYLGKYELTQQQWEQVMLTSPWMGKADIDSIGLNFPAAYISGHDVQAYVEKLTALQNDGIYRLPTGKEWEYACRAGTTTLWFFGNTSGVLNDYAWWISNSGGGFHTVGTKLPNPWGFYDMYGNVAEWVQDSGYPDIKYRDIYGSSYLSSVESTPSFMHAHAYEVYGHPFVGVRILREGPKVSQP